MLNKKQQDLDLLKVLNILFISASVFMCAVLMLVDIPGVELLETNPNWLLIWLVAWSIKRAVWQGAIAGLILGWIYDGITASSPSHALSFILVGILTSSLKKQKYVGEDFISVAFVVFFMTFLAEMVFAWQYARQYFVSMTEIVQKYQQIAIISAIITSLWSPIFYYPFNLWGETMKLRSRSARK